MNISVGSVFIKERTFTVEETLQFAMLSGDKGSHHMEKDEQGRLMVHGLFTASIGTEIGGDLNYIAREITCEFLRPVFTGDTIRCEVKVVAFEQMEGYKKVKVDSVYYNQYGKEVIIGKSHGIIKDV